MTQRSISAKVAPQITVSVSGTLFQGHLSYVDQLIRSAADYQLWPMLNLSRLEELDRSALVYLAEGEGRDFGIVSCPNFIREWMEHERGHAAA